MALDPAEALGTGIAFETDWDFEVRAGSLATVSGIDCLGRDLAFALTQEIDIGDPLTVDELEDVRITVRRVLRDDSRVARITSLDVRRADDSELDVSIVVEVLAETGDRGEFVFSK